jgi:hypothetical protein
MTLPVTIAIEFDLYDEQNRVVKTIYPDGNASRLTSEVLDSTDDTLDQTESYIMDLVGKRIRRTIDKPNTANDVTDIYTFDSSDRLQTENRYSGPNGTPGTSTRSTAYTWNTTQQTSKTVSVTGVSSVVQSMSYGLSGQLENVVTTTSNGSGVVSARVDQGGRRGAANDMITLIERLKAKYGVLEVNGRAI